MGDRAAPLRGELFSTTHVDIETEAKTQGIAKQLGGSYKPSLEEATSFLVVGRRWTEKYDYAVVQMKRAHDGHELRKPTLITFQALAQARDAWSANQNVNVVSELRKHRYDVFEDLIVCFTNMTDQDRESSRILVEERGGRINRQLTRTSSVLVSAVPTGKKVDGARGWGIPVVHPKWVVDSLIIGAAINPSLYALDMPTDRMGIIIKTLPFNAMTSATVAPPAVVQPTSLKPRKSMEWGSFMLKRPTRESSTEAVVSEPQNGSSWRDKNLKRSRDEHHLPKRRATNEQPRDQGTPDDESATEDEAELPRTKRKPDVIEPQGMFANLSFRFHGYSDRELTILQRTVSSHKARVSLSSTDYLVVNSQNPERPPWTENFSGLKVITEWALERSLHYRKNLLDDVWGEPVYHQPTEGATGLSIAISGFSGIELRHIMALIKLSGAQYTETLTAKRHVLIASSANARKIPYAIEWGVPAVSYRWLWHCVIRGKMQVIEPQYALDGRGQRPAPRAVASAPPVTARAVATTRESLLTTPPKPSPHTRAPSHPSWRQAPSERSASFGGTQVEYVDDNAEDRARILRALGGSPEPVQTADEPAPRMRVLRPRPNTFD